MPRPASRRPASTPDPQALASLSGTAPRLTRTADVDPVLSRGSAPVESRPAAVQPAAPKQVKFAGYIHPDVAEEVKDAVSALGGNWTIGSLMEEALTREIKRLAKEHNGGDPFPARTSAKLRVGRRIQ